MELSFLFGAKVRDGAKVIACVQVPFKHVAIFKLRAITNTVSKALPTIGVSFLITQE